MDFAHSLSLAFALFSYCTWCRSTADDVSMILAKLYVLVGGVVGTVTVDAGLDTVAGGKKVMKGDSIVATVSGLCPIRYCT